MKCEKYLEMLSPYLDHELTSKEIAELEAHLRVCENCQDELELLKMIKVGFNTLEDKTLPEGFHQDLMNKIHEDKKLKPFYQHKTFAYLSSLAAVFIFVVVFSSQMQREEVQPDTAMMSMPETATADITGYAVGRTAMPEGEMQAESMADEWRLECKNIETALKDIEEWAIANGYEIQMTIQGQEATIVFNTVIDREKLELFVKESENLSALTVVNTNSEPLVLIIMQSTP